MGGNISVMASLYERAREARRALPKTLEIEGLLALMDFQVARLLAIDIQVRTHGPVPCVVWQ